MAKVPPSARQAGKPQLRPDVTGGAELVVVTIAAIGFRASQYAEKGQQPVLSFEEFPEHELRLGKRGTDRMCEKFGDETDDWLGQTIPLVKNREEVGNKTFIVYQLPPVEEWPALLKTAKARTRK